MVDFGFDEIIKEIDSDAEDFEIDQALEEIKEPVSKRGQVWKLGRHFLMCGDSTTDDVQKFLNRQKVDLYLSDPPYNVAVSNSNGLTIENDDMEDTQFLEFLTSAFYQVEKVLKNGGVFYVFHADTEGYNFRKALKDNNLALKQNLIWVKNQFTIGRQDYQWQHEPCLYGWKEGAGHYFIKNRKQSTVYDESLPLEMMSKEELIELINSTVLRYDKPVRNAEHPTIKPLPMIEKLIKNSTRKNQIVLDTFGGSGTTLIACERLNRICYMLEYDPKFIDVIIKRWEDITGQKAELINEGE